MTHTLLKIRNLLEIRKRLCDIIHMTEAELGPRTKRRWLHSFLFYKNNFYKNKGSNSQKLSLKNKNTLLNVLRLSRFGVFL